MTTIRAGVRDVYGGMTVICLRDLLKPGAGWAAIFGWRNRQTVAPRRLPGLIGWVKDRMRGSQ